MKQARIFEILINNIGLFIHWTHVFKLSVEFEGTLRGLRMITCDNCLWEGDRNELDSNGNCPNCGISEHIEEDEKTAVYSVRGSQIWDRFVTPHKIGQWDTEPNHSSTN